MTDSELADLLLDPFQKPSRLSSDVRTASASIAPGVERATGRPASPQIHLVSSSRLRVLEPRAMADEPWLTGLEERLADRHEVTVAASAASDTRAPAPDPGVEVGHWLAGLEAADEPGDVHEESPRAGGCSTPVQSRSATAWEAGPEASPTPTEGRPEMDDQLDSKEDVPPVALAGLVAQLGEMDADLIRVRVSLANSDAAFSRVVSRWHPVAVPTRLLTGGR